MALLLKFTIVLFGNDKLRWGSFGSSDGIYKEVEMPRVYEMALKTWSDWLEVHVNPNKTQLFFVSMSPTHQRYIYFFQDYLLAG